MRVFVAGASGALGKRLVPQLVAAGHEVTGTHRSPGNAERVRGLGAQPVQLDLLDEDAVMDAHYPTWREGFAVVYASIASGRERHSGQAGVTSPSPT